MAEEVLLISTDDVVVFTSIDGDLDRDKLRQHIKISQDIHIQNYLGTKLFDRIVADVLASFPPPEGTSTPIPEPYLSLLNDHIKPMLIHWTLVQYLPQAPYTVANGGMFKHFSENSDTMSRGELTDLIESERNTAQHYTQRFLDFMCANSQLFPEFNSNQSGDMFPDRDTNFVGWEI